MKGGVGTSKPFSQLQKFLIIVLLMSVMGLIWYLSQGRADTTIGLTLTTNPELENGLVGHWTFDGSGVSGMSVTDRSGGGNTGTMSGGTTTKAYGVGATSDTSPGNYKFTVPPGVTSITVKAWGAGGGGGSAGSNASSDGGGGGGSAYAQSTLSVTPGETLTVYVGGGGGGGVANVTGNSGGGGGGGGYSRIARGSSNLLIAAGGGGGGGGDNSSATLGGVGGGGGNTTSGSTGGASGGAQGGGGGTSSAGGSGGTSSYNDGSAGYYLTGGAGADGRNADGADGSGASGGVNGGGDGGIDDINAGTAGGGGGGSGYYGGGGGGGSQILDAGGGGGGGGSSYTSGSGTTATAGSSGSGTTGGNAGNNGDDDYSSDAGKGGGGSTAVNVVGTDGTDGRVLITYQDVMQTAPGPIGQALSFDGVDDYVNIATSSFTPPSQFTYAAWVLPVPTGTVSGNIFELRIFDADLAIYLDAGVPTFGWFASSPLSGGSAPPNQWTHIAASWDGSNRRLYVNGVLVNSGSAAGAGSLSNTPYYWAAIGRADDGGWSGGQDAYFSGKIDDVRAYSRALSAEEVKRLYTLGATTRIGTTIATNPELENGLLGHWTFDGEDVDISQPNAEIRDRSVTGAHGNWLNHATTTAPGPIGQALSFDGVDDIIFIDSDVANSITSTASFCTWVNMREWATADGDQDKLFQAGDSVDTALYVLNFDNAVRDNGSHRDLLFHAYSETPVVYSGIGSEIDLNEWNHICVVHQNTPKTTLFYVNGHAVSTTGTTGDISGDEITTELGGHGPSGSGTDHMNGSLDDVRIYSRALSAEEVKRLYTLGATTRIATTITTNPELENGLAGHWTFDGSSISGTTTLSRIGSTHGAAQGFSEIIRYTLAGTSTWVSPPSVTNATVEAWGGGGGGGTNASFGGASGGGGAYARSILTVTPSTSYSVYVGFGGQGDNVERRTGTTTFGTNLVRASGGGSATGSGTTPGSGGTTASSIGTVKYAGGNGASNSILYQSGGGGGGAGGPDGAGQDGSAGQLLDSGDGGAGNGGSGGLGGDTISEYGGSSVLGGGGGAGGFDTIGTYGGHGGVCGGGGGGSGEGGSGGAGASGCLIVTSMRITTTPGAIGQALEFDGMEDYVDIGSAGSNIQTVSFWLKTSSSTQYLVDLNGSAYVHLSAGTLTATGFTSPTIYIDGVQTTTFPTDNNWHAVTVTTGTGINASDMDIGRVEGLGFAKGLLDDVRIYSRALSAEEVKRLYGLGN